MSHLANSLGPQVRIEPCFCIFSQKTEILQMMNCSDLQSNGKNSHVIIQNFYQLFIIKPSYLKSTFLTLSLSIFYNDQFLKVVHFELSFCLRRTSNASRCFAETIKVSKSVMWSRTRHPMRTLLSSAGSAEFWKQHGAADFGSNHLPSSLSLGIQDCVYPQNSSMHSNFYAHIELCTFRLWF